MSQFIVRERQASGEPLRQSRALGPADLLDARLIDVSHPDTHHELTSALVVLLTRLGLDRFDRGVMTMRTTITRHVRTYLPPPVP